MSKRHKVKPTISVNSVYCAWCGEELKFVNGKGWIHQDGSIYKQGVDGKDDHCVLPKRS